MPFITRYNVLQLVSDSYRVKTKGDSPCLFRANVFAKYVFRT